MSDKKVALLLAEGFEEIEAVTLVDVIRRGGIEIKVVALDTKAVVGAHDITVQADLMIESLNGSQLDMVVLPGGWGGTKKLAQDSRVQKLLQQMNDDRKLIAAICAAPYALDQAGVLKAPFTCYPGVEADIAQSGYRSDATIVRTENILTSQGPATAMAFGLEIVKLLVGEAKASQVEKALLFKPL